MKRQILCNMLPVLAMTCLGILACSKSDDGSSRLRVENVSGFDFDEVLVWTVSHGSIASGEMSQYAIVETMYDKVTIGVIIDSLQFGQTVIDYVGEDPLRPGDFTLQIDIPDLSDQGSLTQHLVRD